MYIWVGTIEMQTEKIKRFLNWTTSVFSATVQPRLSRYFSEREKKEVDEATMLMVC